MKILPLSILVAGLLCSLPWLARAAQTPTSAESSTPGPAQNSAPANPALPASESAVLQRGEIISVQVENDPNATHDYHIGVDGTVQLIYLDSAPPLKLAGLTILQAKQAVIKAYVDNKIFNAPSIAIDVKEHPVRFVNVIGQVRKPGLVYIPVQKDMTLVEAITEAGGPTNQAASTVTITRIMPDGSTRVLENVDLYGAMKDAKKDIPLQDGDTVSLSSKLLA